VDRAHGVDPVVRHRIVELVRSIMVSPRRSSASPWTEALISGWPEGCHP
jgi:hypothetical protein